MAAQVVTEVMKASDALLFDGMTFAVGNCGRCGMPDILINGLCERHVKDLCIIEAPNGEEPA